MPCSISAHGEVFGADDAVYISSSPIGSVEVELPEDVHPQIRCHTVSGNIDRIPESQPDSASLLDVNTVSGDITIQ